MKTPWEELFWPCYDGPPDDTVAAYTEAEVVKVYEVAFGAGYREGSLDGYQKAAEDYY